MIETADAESAEQRELDQLYDDISAIVCQHGPELLTRGMPAVEANRAILACFNHLLTTRVPVDLMKKLEAESNDWQTRARAAEKKLQVINA